jgi:hypothetical protein
MSSGNDATIHKPLRPRRSGEARTFLRRHQDDGQTMHITARPRPTMNKEFSRAIDDVRYLAEIAVVQMK